MENDSLFVENIEICRPLTRLIRHLEALGGVYVNGVLADSHFNQLKVFIRFRNRINDIETSFKNITKQAPDRFTCSCHWSTLHIKQPDVAEADDFVPHYLLLEHVKKTENRSETKQVINDRVEKLENHAVFEVNRSLEAAEDKSWIYVNSPYTAKEDCDIWLLMLNKVLHALRAKSEYSEELAGFLMKTDGRDAFNQYDPTIFLPYEVMAFVNFCYEYLPKESLQVEVIQELEKVTRKCEEASKYGFYLKCIKMYTA